MPTCNQVLQYLQDKYSAHAEDPVIMEEICDCQAFLQGYLMAMGDVETYYENLAVWEAS